MSSIRDALKKAERERRARAEMPSTASSGPSPFVEPVSPPAAETSADRQTVASSYGGNTSEDPVESPRQEEAELGLHVVAPDPIPLIEVPLGFAEELALFRRGDGPSPASEDARFLCGRFRGRSDHPQHISFHQFGRA